MDPHARNTISDFAVLSNFYEPLVSTDSNMTLQPCLARQWENPDLSTWTFHLQNGVKFHSGKALTAEDVVYSIERVLNSTTLEISGYVSQIKDVAAVGPLAVRIRTKQPMSVLLNKIRFVLIVPKGTDALTLQRGVDGTGPYRFVGWNGSVIEMKANESYWGGAPDIQDVIYDLGQSPRQALQSLLAGKVQLAQANTKQLEEAIRNRREYTMHRSDSFFLKYLGYDLSGKNARPNPFLDKRVREAIHIGLNRQTLVNGLTTYAAAATQPLPPFIFGYNPQITAPRSDQQRAKELLEAAGLGNG
ncbi:MAG TPA: ABC transporter substrate-binding protein, partial [Acidobacteriota bacterium]|nr:ABC transporter substrate-binding protein [Acidobacteriota bacterium]